MAGKKKRNRNNLTARQQEFCDWYSRYAGNLGKVASTMHISLQACSNILNEENVKEYLGSTLNRSRERLIQALPSVIDNMIEMIHNPNTSDSTKAQLTIALMDRAGLQPPKGSNNVSINANILISDRARQLLAERTGTPIEAMPPMLAQVSINEDLQRDFT